MLRTLAVLLLLTISPAYSNSIAFHGCFKSYPIEQVANNLPPSIFSIDAYTRLGVVATAEPFRGELVYVLQPLFQTHQFSTLLLTFNPTPLNYRIADWNPQIYKTHGEFHLYHNLDRALFSYRPSWAQIEVGRQPLSFGVSRVVVPMDVITFYSFFALDREYRIGVDAARILIPINELSTCGFGYISGHNLAWDQSALYGQARTNLYGYDLQLLLMEVRENTLLGAAVETSLWDAGAWFEAAYVWAHHQPVPILAKNYLRLSTGMDYKFANSLYLFAEYHYSQAGTTHRTQYITNLPQVAYTELGVYLLGQHYFTPGMSYDIDPLTTISSELLTNLTDIGTYLHFKCVRSITDNFFIDVGTYISIGTGSQAEFGYYPTIFYAALRQYF